MRAGGGARARFEEREEGRDGMMEKGRKWQAIKEAAAERTTSPNNNGAEEGERNGQVRPTFATPNSPTMSN